MPCALRGAFVIGDTALSPLLKACAMALRDTSCRTAFCCTDKAVGATTAQALGLQYYPVQDTGCATVSAAVDKAGEAYGAIDVLVYEVSGTLYVDVSGAQSTISQAPDCPLEVFIAAASRLLVYLALPQSIDLSRRSFRHCRGRALIYNQVKRHRTSRHSRRRPRRGLPTQSFRRDYRRLLFYGSCRPQ